MATGTLFVVSTPIGNLEDITMRALRVLKEVDLIAAEDTRRTAKLLGAYGITAKVTSFNSHNAGSKTPGLIRHLSQGLSIALVSDSGTPGISDPGSVLITECISQKIPLTSVPGPSALLAGLIISGKPANKFVFEGFLSSKPGRRKRRIEELKDEERTVVIYESPHRIVKLLKDVLDVAGNREIAVARELTKKFEEIKRGPVEELIEHFEKTGPRGEFTVIM